MIRKINIKPILHMFYPPYSMRYSKQIYKSRKKKNITIYIIKTIAKDPPPPLKKIKVLICQQIKNDLCHRFNFDLKKIAICEKKTPTYNEKEMLNNFISSFTAQSNTARDLMF